MTNNTSPQVHVRPSEVVAQLAISIPDEIMVRTFHSHDEQGLGYRVEVEEIMWTTADVSAPTLVVRLTNGQEFELEARYSSHELRTARLAVEHAAGRAERVQDDINAAAKTSKEV